MKQFFVVIVLVFLLNGCSTLKIQVDSEPEFNFSSLSKFTVIYTKKDDTNDFTRSRISNMLSQHFENMGYISSSKEDSDFYLILHLDIYNKSQTETTYETMGVFPIVDHHRASLAHDKRVKPYLNTFDSTITIVRTHKYDYEESRVVIELLDVKSNSIVWQGIAEDDLFDLLTQAEKSKYINRVLEELFKDFPNKSS